MQGQGLKCLKKKCCSGGDYCLNNGGDKVFCQLHKVFCQLHKEKVDKSHRKSHEDQNVRATYDREIETYIEMISLFI